MTVKRLKEIIKDMPDDLEIYIRNSVNICGNIGELYNIEKSAYGFFGSLIPCLILNTDHTQKKLMRDENDKYIDYEENDGTRS